MLTTFANLHLANARWTTFFSDFLKYSPFASLVSDFIFQDFTFAYFEIFHETGLNPVLFKTFVYVGTSVTYNLFVS